MYYPGYEWVDLIGLALVIGKVVFVLTCLAFFISGLDDLFIDLCYWGRGLYRALNRRRIPQMPTESELISLPEQPIAVMLPAWDESSVIRSMLINAARTINYRNVHFFVGTYPNDPATYREVEAAQRSFDNIHQIVTPNDGPTNKADCLNWIYHGIKRFEQEQAVCFQIFVMQDCEDVIHSLCYKIFNHAIPETDMVQLPVHSLPRRWNEFTGGHYLDEFAQLHTKDLVVREMLTGSLPGAGVGLAFSRRALETVALHNSNEVFSTKSLTEDYDFGFRLHEHGLSQSFIRYSVPRRLNGQGGLLKPKYREELVCVKEFFPGGFQPAVRQKSRWILGIVFQGWRHIGWPRGIAVKYFLFRDRKALVTNFINLLGYIVVAVILLETANNTLLSDSYRFPPLIEPDGLLWYLVLLNGLFLLERVVMRMYCVYRLHGSMQALLSLPRMIWGNFINFFATVRAVRLYLSYLTTGKLIAWDKTAHVYPTDEQLGVLRPRLGDLLMARRLITAGQLHQALEQQAARHRPLGRILVEMNAVEDAALQEVLEAA